MAESRTLRYADSETAGRYPLPVAGPADWQPSEGGWRLMISLPALEPGLILVPSLALGEAPTPAGDQRSRHRWILRDGASEWPLPHVPSRRGPEVAPGPAAEAARGAVSSHIDCFHVHRPLSAPVLELSLLADARPERYLIAVSRRALTLARPPAPQDTAGLSDPPPPRSQTTAPPEIAQRICSPTCVSMVLNLWRRPHDWLALVEECRDPASGLYGVWPLALRAAARRGSLGAVEVFGDWAEPLAVLQRGIPLVTSIRFANGELPGAPLTDTGGHLVVVHAADPREVHVCDPAAPDGQVQRVYPAEAFSGAWLRHRGAAYILPP